MSDRVGVLFVRCVCCAVLCCALCVCFRVFIVLCVCTGIGVCFQCSVCVGVFWVELGAFKIAVWSNFLVSFNFGQLTSGLKFLCVCV